MNDIPIDEIPIDDIPLKPSSPPSESFATSFPVNWAASPDNYPPTSRPSLSRPDLHPTKLRQGLSTAGCLPVVTGTPTEASDHLCIFI